MLEKKVLNRTGDIILCRIVLLGHRAKITAASSLYAVTFIVS